MRMGRALAALVVVAGLGLVLSQLGDPALTIPWGRSGDLLWWLDETPPPIMAAALLRLVVLVWCGYVGVVLVVAIGAEVAGRRDLARGVLRAAPAVLRRLLVGGTHLTLAAGVVLSSAGAAHATPGLSEATTADPLPDPVPVSPPPSAVMALLEPGTEAPATATMVELTPPATTPATTLPPPPPTRTEPSTAGTSDRPTPPTTAPVIEEPTWVVQQGDSFWSIAEAVLMDEADERWPSDRAIGRYWNQLIVANRDRLAAPDHPDLLIPGQVLTIPELGER